MADLDTGPDSYIRIPPDSAGKRLVTTVYLAIDYSSGTSDFVVGATITATTSNFIGTITSLRTGNLTASGTIYVIPSVNSPTQDVVAAEDLFVGGIKFAEVATSLPFYLPGNVILGHSNPQFGLNIDNRGAAFVRFTDGSQQLSAFGSSKVAPSEQLAAYTFFYDLDPFEWTHETAGTASSISHLPLEASIALDIDTTPNDYAISTTNRYHVYQPGFGQFIEMTIVCGDSGKDGNTRRWGYYDDNDGLFFELDETNIYVVQRSSTSGGVIDTRIIQSDWSSDTLDGSRDEANPSDLELDVTKINLYWIDFAWLGAGTVRFGIFGPNGDRIVAHTFTNPNANPRPYMRTGSLPLRIENVNAGTSGTSGPSRLKLTCAQVEVEGKIVPTFERRSIKWTVTSDATVNSEQLIAAWRPKLTIYGVRNNKTTVAESIRCYVTGQPAILRLYSLTSVVGGTWTSIEDRIAGEINFTGSYPGGGNLLFDWYVDPGSHMLDMPPNFNLLGIAGRLNADDLQVPVVLTAESLEPTTGDTTIAFSFTGLDI